METLSHAWIYMGENIVFKANFLDFVIENNFRMGSMLAIIDFWISDQQRFSVVVRN